MGRRRRSDSYDEDDDFRAKKDRIDKDTVESLMYRVGSKDLSNIERDIGELTSLVLADISRNSDRILKVLVKCVKNIPERMLLYATMVGLLNMKNPSFVGQLMDLLLRELKDAIRSANFEDAKYIILFLSASVNCYTVSTSSVMNLYENFAEVTLDADRSSQARKDWYAYLILYGLPYSGELLAAADSSALNDIIGTLEVYMTKRQRSHVLLLRVWESDDPHPQEDYLDCLWAQIKNLQAAGWQERVTWRLYDSFPSLKELGHPHKLPTLTPPDYDAEVVYPIPRVIFRMFDYTDVIEQDEEESTEDLESGTAQAKRETAVLPGAHTIERFIIDEQLSIIMNNMSFNRMFCAKTMLGLRTRARVALDYMIIEAVFAGMFQLPHPAVQHGNLLFYGSLLIQLCQEASSTIPLVLAQATEVLYERLDYMKPVCIGRFIEWFSYHLSNYQLQWSWKEWSGAVTEDAMSPHRRMITETLSRLIRFSYYENVKRLLPKSFYIMLPPPPTILNKYEANPDLPSARTFYRLLDSIRSRTDSDVILKLAQGALLPRAQRRSPTEPFDDEDENRDSDNRSNHSDEERRGPSGNSTPNSVSEPELDDMDDDDDAPGESHAARPRLNARRRLLRESGRKPKVPKDTNLKPEAITDQPGVDMMQWTDLSPGVTNLSVELFFSALLIAGHKTISHTFSFIKKYEKVIRTITSTVETQVEALHVIQTVWANNPQMIVIITEHMCRMGLFDPEAIVRWAYSQIMTSLQEIPVNYNPTSARPKILDFYVWECLSRTLVRVGRRVARITTRLELAKENMELARRRQMSSSPERDADGSDRDGSPSYGRSDDHRSHKFKKPHKIESNKSLSRSDKRNLMAGCELISSSDEDEDFLRAKGPIGNRVTRLEEAKCEAVLSECAVITLLLHRHARLTAELADEASGRNTSNSFGPDSLEWLQKTNYSTNLSEQALQYIAFWLKGRLVQVVLEHYNQLMPYLDNLDESICGAHPEVQEVFHQLRSLFA